MIEKTLVLLKPDTVQRCLVGKIIERFENVGLKIVALKMIWADENTLERHYRLTEDWVKNIGIKTRKAYAEKGIEVKESDIELAKKVQGNLKVYMKEGPIVAMILEGPHAVESVRKIVGSTEPRQAIPGTIRGDWMVDSYMVADAKKRPIRNLIHASGTKEEAEHEISIWFSQEDILEYEHNLDKHFKV